MTRANVLFTTAYIGAAVNVVASWKGGPRFALAEKRIRQNLQRAKLKESCKRNAQRRIHISSRWCGCLCAWGRGVRKREIECISYIIHYRIKRVWLGLWLVSSEKCLYQKH